MNLFTKMQAQLNDIVEKSLKKAHEHDTTGNAGKAYAYYTVVTELCPQRRSDIEEVFTNVLCEWGIDLASKNRFEDVVLCYKRSLDIYPTNTRMLNNFAAHLLRNNDAMRAIFYLKQALKIDPTFLPAERNLQNAYSMAVDRWHFPMLNDKKRNNAFKHAIKKRILQGYDTVLDVGTGTGLLSLYARDAGAKQIYACECSPIMAHIAEKVFKENDASDIKLLPKLSSHLKIPTDIPERVKLIVTETFDAGLFGELVVPFMINAHINILNTNGMGMIIPMSATLYVAAVECEYIRYRSSVVLDKIKDFCPLNFDSVSVLSDDEYYDTENLEYVKINYVTEPQVLLKINFNDFAQLEAFSKDGIKGSIHAKCRYDGTIDGLVTWFKLHLDEQITIDSSEGKSCWQLAVFPALPNTCKQGNILSVKAEMFKGKLKCSYLSNAPVCNNTHEFLYHLPKEVIIFLNDSEYVRSLCLMSRSHKSKTIKNVLDTSPFPVYGLMLLRENKNIEKLYYETHNRTLHLFIEKVAENNGCQDKLCFISSYDEIQQPLDHILVHNFDMKGELKDWGQMSYQEFFSSLLQPTGMLLPEKLFLMGQLVFSEDLPKMVLVKDSNLQGMSSCTSSTSISEKTFDEEDLHIWNTNDSNSSHYVIAKYVNEYKIDQIFDLNSSLYLYEALSKVHTMIEINEQNITEAVVNFGRIKVTKNQPIPNALVCWYKIPLTTDIVYDTRRTESFMNHCAIVLEDDLRDVISKGKDVKIRVQQAMGLIKISVLKS